MDLFDAIRTRLSYRGSFKDLPVPRTDLDRLVEAGLFAPSGCNAQSTSFIIIDDPVLLRKIGEILDRPYIRTAPAMIACVCATGPARAGSPASYYKEDAAAAVENMLLAITALGYATVWLQGVLSGDVGPRIAALLSVPKDRELLILLPVGVPVEPGKAPTKKTFAERVSYNGFA